MSISIAKSVSSYLKYAKLIEYKTNNDNSFASDSEVKRDKLQ